MFKKVIKSPHTLRTFLSFNLVIYTTLAIASDVSSDSIRSIKLNELEVNCNQHASRSALPTQIATQKEIKLLNAFNISDVAKHFAGVTVKDYGGIGGLKTVSIRGLGAMHTGVCYDGVMLSDVQSGQIDLSHFSIENMDQIALINAQPNDLLQSARMFSSSGVLSFTSAIAHYDPKHPISGHIKTRIASFGMLNPSLALTANLSEKLAIQLTSNYLQSDGDYKYKSYINLSKDKFEIKERLNSDIHSSHTEFNSIYKFNPAEQISFKTNYYYSERGIPGPDILYSSFATERLLDKILNSQICYSNKKSKLLQTQLSAKFNNTSMLYSETSGNYSSLENNKRIDNYSQKEYYLSNAWLYRPIPALSISTALDWFYNNLFSDSNISFRTAAEPSRNTLLANMATKYTHERYTVGANLLYTLCRETNQYGDAASDKFRWSPAFFMTYQLFEDKDFRLRAFYKNIFRLPTFNDLYYHDFGYSELSPENTYQFNIGVTYNDKFNGWIDQLACTFDAYYNQITDKITIVYGMPFSSVRNIGKVEIKGSDLTIRISKNISEKSKLSLSANYAFQLAQNNTEDSENYKDIIPYTPIHSGSGSLLYQYKNIEFGYNYLFASKTYVGQNSNKSNIVSGYMENNILLGLNLKKLDFQAEVINLFNQQYEIVQFYPMPGINYRITASYNF